MVHELVASPAQTKKKKTRDHFILSPQGLSRCLKGENSSSLNCDGLLSSGRGSLGRGFDCFGRCESFGLRESVISEEVAWGGGVA